MFGEDLLLTSLKNIDDLYHFCLNIWIDLLSWEFSNRAFNSTSISEKNLSLGVRFEWRTLCGDFENSYSTRSSHVSGIEQLAYIFVWASCMFKAGGNLNVAEIQISNICHIVT